jgi:hypothetical protein
MTIDNATMVGVGTLAMPVLLPAINIVEDPEIVW